MPGHRATAGPAEEGQEVEDMTSNPFAKLNTMRVERLEAALDAAERLGAAEGLYDVTCMSASGLMALMVGNTIGAAERGLDAAGELHALIEDGEYAADGDAFAVGQELWRAANAVRKAVSA
jgi:hypothetical protein